MTVHAHGEGEPGIPVKINMRPDGTAHVVAGAGGALTGLRLEKLRSPAEWAASAKDKAEKRRQEKAAQHEQAAAEAKKLGIQPQTVTAKKEQGAADTYKIERERIQRVAKVLGWDEKTLKMDDAALESIPPQQRDKALAAHHRQLHAKAQEALKNIREGLVKSATARAEAGMGVAGDDAAKDIALSDLIRLPSRFTQPGYAPQTSERLQKAHQDIAAKVHALDADALRQETNGLEEAFQHSQTIPGEPVTAAARKRGSEMHERFSKEVAKRLDDGDLYGARKAVADALIEQTVLRPEKLADTARRLEEKDKPELAKMGYEAKLEMAAERRRISEQVRGSSHVDQLPVNPTSYKDALALLQAEKQVKPIEERARAAKQGPIEAAVQEAKQGKGAIQIVSKELTDEQAQAAVARDIEDRLRENAARSLLRAYDGDLEDQIQTPQQEREHNLRQAVGIGAHQALANASLVFAEHGGLAREAVDVLGAGPSAQILAAHLRARLSPEDRKSAVEAIGRFHADEVRKDTEDTLKQANESYEAAKAIEIPQSVSDGNDIMTAMEMTERKREFLEDAREAIGLAVGKFEATAALEFALQQDKDEPIQVKFPDVSRETMIKQLHALGLKPDEHYSWSHDGKNGYVELNPNVHEVLAAHAPSAETLKRNALIRDIRAGKHDEPDFIPPGFARRPKSSFEQHGQDLPNLTQPFKMGDSIEESLLQHVGSRVASGEPVWKILPTLNNASEGPLAEAIKAGKASEYGKILDKLAPTHLNRDEKALQRLHSEQEEHSAQEPDRWQRPSGPVSDDWRAWKQQQELALGRDDGSADYHKRAEEYAAKHHEPEGGGTQSPEHVAWEVKGRELQRESRRAEGRPAGPADWQAAFDSAADKFLSKEHPGADPIHRQRLNVEDPKESADVLEAIHRTIAPMPALKAALKNPGDMTNAERKALRDWHMQNVVQKGSAESKKKVDELRKRLDEHEQKAPEEFSHGLFGQERTPEHVEWKQKRDAMAQELADLKKTAGDMTWEDYATAVGGVDRAMGLAAEFARGQVADQFANHYERITGKRLRTTQAKIADDDLHDYALNPEARAQHEAETARQGLEMRRGVGGRATSDAVRERLAAAESRAESRELGQGILLGSGKGPDVKHARTTLGAGMERQLAGLVDAHFHGLDPRWQPGLIQPIPDATMTGRFLPQQRIVKAAVNGKKIGIGAGVGSGKTRISLGTFAQANHQGEAKRGLFAVPSAVVGQFATEAQTWLEPGKFNTFHSAGSSKPERMAAYRDPGKHMVFVGHEQLRDDLRDMVGAAKGWTPEQARARIMQASPAEVDAMVSEALHKHGAEGLLDYYSIDEGHQTLNRKGKPDSLLAKLSDSLMRQSKRANMMTGTMSKNDMSEVQDVLAKLNPAQFGDRSDFMRRYDVGTNSAKEALRREIDNYIYTAQVDPGTRAVRAEIKVPLHEKQKARLDEIGKAYQEAKERSRNLRMNLGDKAENTKALTEAMRRLYPKAFQDAHPEDYEAKALKLASAAGTLRDTATYDAIHAAKPGENAKIQKAVELAKLYSKNDPKAIFEHLVKLGQKKPEERADWLAQEERSPHHGKPAPGIMFMRSLDGVDKLGKALEDQGLRVKTFTGAMDAKVKAQAQQDYKSGKFDVMVVSDAGAAGLNLQRGRYSVQIDSPQTWKTHAQRSGRINRVGQKEHEPHLYDLVGEHPFEQQARDRLARKRDLHQLIHDERELADDTGLASYFKRVKAEMADKQPHAPQTKQAA